LAATGDQTAREQLAQLALSIARSTLLRRGVSGGELADLVQEAQRTTFSFLARNPSPPKDLGAFLKYRAWGVLSDYRKKMRASRLDYRSDLDPTLQRPAGPGAITRDPLRAREMASALADCRRRLPQELGRVLGLRYDAELATEAIQRRLGVHRNTIHVRVFRALEQMRNCMSAKGFGAEDLL
jgi:RNA polymerase sigma factor (sigma-70 family)